LWLSNTDFSVCSSSPCGASPAQMERKPMCTLSDMYCVPVWNLVCHFTERHRPRVFGYRVLRKCLVVEGKKQHSEELNDVFTSYWWLRVMLFWDMMQFKRSAFSKFWKNWGDQIGGNKAGGNVARMVEVRKLLTVRLETKDQLEIPDVNRRILLKWLLEKVSGVVDWLYILRGTSGGLLWALSWTFSFPKVSNMS
jgi:hypothetical protein